LPLTLKTLTGGNSFNEKACCPSCEGHEEPRGGKGGVELGGPYIMSRSQGCGVMGGRQTCQPKAKSVMSPLDPRDANHYHWGGFGRGGGQLKSSRAQIPRTPLLLAERMCNGIKLERTSENKEGPYNSAGVGCWGGGRMF